MNWSDMSPRERALGLLEMLEWDWAYTTTASGRRLHHMAHIEDPLAFDWERRGLGTTTCGRTGVYAIPGLFSRMGMPRCSQCCTRLGIAQGDGSPKNDDDLRPWVEGRVAALRAKGVEV